jgi:hypothetical protein
MSDPLPEIHAQPIRLVASVDAPAHRRRLGHAACDNGPVVSGTRHGNAPSRRRLSDGERGRALESLKADYARGLISLEELEARAEGLYTARTRGEIATHLRDLPLRGWRNLAVAVARTVQRVVLRIHLSVYATANASLIAIWMLTGQGTFWPAWLLVPSTALLAWHAVLSRRLTRRLLHMRP